MGPSTSFFLCKRGRASLGHKGNIETDAWNGGSMGGCYCLTDSWKRITLEWEIRLVLHYEVGMSEFCLLKVLQRFRFLIHPPQTQHSKLSLAWSASVICQQDSHVQTELTIAEGGGTKEAVQQHRIAHLRGFKRPTITSYLCQSWAIIGLGGPMQVKLSVTKGSPGYSY